MGEKQPVGIESRKIKEINNFLEELKKVDYRGVLASVFQDFTLDKSRKLRGNILIGKTEDKENSPLIVLTDLRGVERRRLRLQVFRKETHFNQYPGSGDLVVFAGPDPNDREMIKTIIFDLKSNIESLSTYSLSDKYSSFLIDILGEVNSRFKKARSGK